MNKRNLDEVSLIRPILIVLLVLYHAFAPWCGAWKPFDGFEENEVYWWIAKSAYSFMLPMFVFISGYVWAYQREELLRRESFMQLIIKKSKRLYIPSIVFSIAYLFLIDGYSIDGGGNLVHKSMDILSGYAHMWFLPMLLWNFIITWCLLQIKQGWLRWCIILILSLLTMLKIPLGISNAFYYIIYFYAGYEIYTKRNNLERLLNPYALTFQWLFFIITFVLLSILSLNISPLYVDGSIFIKAVGIVMTNVFTKAYGFMGIFALYCTCVYYCRNHVLSNLTINIGSYCFGVYIFQQFILDILYYHTTMLSEYNIYIPWVGFLSALFISITMAVIFSKTKIGQKLL